MMEELKVRFYMDKQTGCISFYLPDLAKAFGIKIHKPGKSKKGWISYCELGKLAREINELIWGFDETLVLESEKQVKFMAENREEKGDAADGRRSAGRGPESR